MACPLLTFAGNDPGRAGEARAVAPGTVEEKEHVWGSAERGAEAGLEPVPGVEPEHGDDNQSRSAEH
eukprot:11208983-Lingulodinium_polyedra.AAC.1